MSGSVLYTNTQLQKSYAFWKKPLFRQMFIASLSWNTYLLTGLTMATSTVAIPQMREEGIDISPEMATWFTTIIGVGGISWLAAPLLVKLIGLRRTYLLVYLSVFVGALIIYFCNSATHYLIGQALCGSTNGVAISISILFIADYSSPAYRGIFLTLKTATCLWGTWIANTIGTFFYWRYIIMIDILLSVYGLMLFFIPESPFWLASKGRVEESKVSFRWFRGRNDATEKELEQILSADYDNIHKKGKSILKHIKDIANPEFYKPFLIAIILGNFIFLSGKLAYHVYAIEILRKLTAKKSTAYHAMLVMDGISIISLYVGCFITKKFNRRTLFFIFSVLSALFLYILSFFLLLVKEGVLNENDYITLLLLALFSTVVSCGPTILCNSIVAEIIPLQFRSSFTFLLTALNLVGFVSSLKFAPFIFNQGLFVAFLSYAIISSIAILILYKIMPETKDKTLVELSNIFKKQIINNVEAEKLMNIVENKPVVVAKKQLAL